jgi:hypothetical protein
VLFSLFRLAVAHVVGVRAKEEMVGSEAARVIAAMEDVQLAAELEAEEERGGKAVHRVAPVPDRDPTVPPTVTPALPLPTTRCRVDRPQRQETPFQ